MATIRWAATSALVLAAVAMLAGVCWSRPALAAPTAAGDVAATPASLPPDSSTVASSFGSVRAVEAVGTASAGAATTAVATAAGAHIGLQAGHWLAAQAPAPFNTELGSSGGGKTEAEVNLAIAQATADDLRAAGYVVDLLPTAIPAGYRADLVVAIHADGGAADARGFFVDHSDRPATATNEAKMSDALTRAYQAVGIPNVDRSTVNSRRYYGYFSVAPTTPMVLIETGFLTSALDRAVLVQQPALAGDAIARGIQNYLQTAK